MIMNFSPEVLIYIQTVKNYLNTNKEAHDYFLGNSDETLFFEHLAEISQKNFEKEGEVMLNREQFDLLRKTIIAITIAKSEKFNNKKVILKQEDFNYYNGVFIELLPNFGLICLN
jgi:hypothetical protein